jgi:hypothetical protein
MYLRGGGDLDKRWNRWFLCMYSNKMPTMSANLKKHSDLAIQTLLVVTIDLPSLPWLPHPSSR